MLRRNIVFLGSYVNSTGHYGPPVYMPLEYTMRIANLKPLEFMKPTDPKYTWNTHMDQIASLTPGLFGHGRKVPTYNYSNKGGIPCEIPPIPVYREHIWCMGHAHFILQHPRIFIKCLPGKVTVCKWCRCKFINMSTAEDNDNDWREEEHKIATTPESLEDLNKPIRDLGGVLRQRRFQDDKQPDPHVYRAVFDPERYRWKHEHHELEVHPAYGKQSTIPATSEAETVKAIEGESSN
mmetsp:Transcript_69283/g.80839  ORF Transcript_69283/g.80839 Transcript_69283/m.80839 type:complete len:237 (+) Transcript_69283:27-737(+)